jgi:hypothetical protein
VTQFPNATVAEYGTYHYDTFAMQAEIFFRGPVKASVDAGPLQNYTGGVLWDAPAYESDHHNHVSLMCVSSSTDIVVSYGYCTAARLQCCYKCVTL